MPKIGLKKSTSTSEVNNLKTVNDNMNGTNKNNAKSQQNLTASSIINKTAKTLRVNENKPPIQPLSRSRTVGAITRGTTTSSKPSTTTTTLATKTAIKRPATAAATSTIAAKRTRPGITGNSSLNKTTRPGVGVTTKTTLTTKPAASSAAAKISKWDWKGRFGLVNDELTALKEKHKFIAGDYDELKNIVDDLKTRENETSIKNEQLKLNNDKLIADYKKAENDVNKLIEKNKLLDNELKESQETNEIISKSLEKYKKTCDEQEDKLIKHKSQVRILENELNDKKNTIDEQIKLIKDLQELVHGMDKDRRNLHNTIQELKGNIRVFCRVRPKIDKETMKIPCSINYLDECTMEIGRADGSDAVSCTGKSRGTKQEFTFDKIFPPTATQADVFEELSMLVQSALEGYNVCVFAYGQTGSGKTYTMEGACNPDYEGMIPRTVRHIFKEMEEFKLLGWEYKVEASFLEIYNEHIVDLLDSKQKNHEIRMTDAKGTDLYVTNLKTVEINCPDELHMWLRTAQQNRAVAATKANDRSSRSHSVARIRLIATHAVKEEMCVGNLNLVDLAGSERLKNEEAARTTETKNINKSLANLGNVILALLKKTRSCAI